VALHLGGLMNDDGLPRLPSLPWIRRIHDGYEQKKKKGTASL